MSSADAAYLLSNAGAVQSGVRAAIVHGELLAPDWAEIVLYISDEIHAALASIVLPPLAGGQAESWAALIEVAPELGENWLLVVGQMVFLHELERSVADMLAPDNVGSGRSYISEPGARSKNLGRPKRSVVEAS